jgi:hypothetical protein
MMRNILWNQCSLYAITDKDIIRTGKQAAIHQWSKSIEIHYNQKIYGVFTRICDLMDQHYIRYSDSPPDWYKSADTQGFYQQQFKHMQLKSRTAAQAGMGRLLPRVSQSHQFQGMQCGSASLPLLSDARYAASPMCRFLPLRPCVLVAGSAARRAGSQQPLRHLA